MALVNVLFYWDGTEWQPLQPLDLPFTLADDSVTTVQIQDNAVTAAKIAANAVGSSELADDAVDTAAIQNGAVTDAKITGPLSAVARVGVRKNSTGSTFERRRLNLIEGSNVTLTVADDSGSEEVDVTIAAAGGSGAVATDAIWDAKGDLAVGSGADAADNLTVGSNDQVLVADSAQTLGVKWAAVPGLSGYVPLATIDAKGDLLVGSANDALDNLTVGTNGYVLTADSGETLGVKWAAAGVSTGGTQKLYDFTITGSDQAAIDTQVDDGGNGAAALPTSFTVLEIWAICRTDDAGASASVDLIFNNDTGGNYYTQRISVVSGTSAASAAVAQTQIRRTLHGSGGSASFASMLKATIPGYAGTTFYKVGDLIAATNDATAGNNQLESLAITYASTSAITRVKVAAISTAKLKVGSRLMIFAR